MSDLLDTSVLVRYLVAEPKDMADLAVSLIDNEASFFVTSETLAETGYVLTTNYQVSRASTVDALSAFLARRNIETLPFTKAVAIRALEFCRNSNRVSFADAMLWASAASRGDRVVTFDRRFPDSAIELVFPS